MEPYRIERDMIGQAITQAAPKGFRLHIGLFGRRNVGKSSLLNAITRQNVSIVSEIAGTTTDPVEKPMEFLPFGPVLFIDTAGIDDTGALGELRIHKTRQIIDRTDLGIIVSEAGIWGEFEEQLVAELKARNVPAIAVFNKSDLAEPDKGVLNQLAKKGIRVVGTAAISGRGILELRQTLLDVAPVEFINRPAILGDLIGAGIPIWREIKECRLS